MCKLCRNKKKTINKVLFLDPPQYIYRPFKLEEKNKFFK